MIVFLSAIIAFWQTKFATSLQYAPCASFKGGSPDRMSVVMPFLVQILQHPRSIGNLLTSRALFVLPGQNALLFVRSLWTHMTTVTAPVQCYRWHPNLLTYSKTQPSLQSRCTANIVITSHFGAAACLLRGQCSITWQSVCMLQAQHCSRYTCCLMITS